MELQAGVPVTHRVEIPRYRCTSCGHTHALLSCGLVPYRSYSLQFILHVLRCYFLRSQTVAALCQAAGISPATLYECKKLFVRQKALWLGVLCDLEQPAVSFLDGLSGKERMDFYGTFRYSFLQRMPCAHGEAPSGNRKAGGAIT